MSKNDPTAAGSVKHLGVVFVNSELPSPDAASSSTPRSPSKVVLMSNEPMRDLKALFEELADVRRSAAEEYPEDAERNLMAAKCLDRLAATCRHVKPEWVKAFNAAEADPDKNDTLWTGVEVVAAYIGVDFDNAEDFIKSVLKDTQDSIEQMKKEEAEDLID